MKRILQIVSLLAILISSASAQTTVNITNTVSLANIDRPGVVIGPVNYFGNGQILKNLTYSSFSNFAPAYANLGFYCTSGGTTNTTHFYSSSSNSQGFPAGYFNGDTYLYIPVGGGTQTTGTISTSSANTSTGLQLVLTTALPASPTCPSGTNQTAQDELVIFHRPNINNVAPSFLLQTTGTATYSSTHDSTIAGQTQSLQLVNGSVSFYPDAVSTNTMNTTGVGSTQVPNILINGNYSLPYSGQCISSGCSIAYNISRGGGSTFINGTDSPSGTGTWTQYNHTFTGNESCNPNTNCPTQVITMSLTCTGTCLIQNPKMLEGSTLSGNTTPFRDSVVQTLLALKPGSLRLMSGNEWCTDATDAIVLQDAENPCTSTPYLGTGVRANTFGTPIAYDSFLQLAYFIGTDAVIAGGTFQRATDMTALANFLGTTQCSICTAGQTWNSLFAAKSLHILFTPGNEIWNSGIPAADTVLGGDGLTAGVLDGALTTAFKGASGYSSTTDYVSWSGAQGITQSSENDGGWASSIMSGAGCTSHSATPTKCPEYYELATYSLSQLNSLSTVYQDEFQENTNTDSVPISNSSGNGLNNIYSAQAFINGTYGVNVMIYEQSYGLYSGSATPTQTQMNQISASVGMALTNVEHQLLMQRDALVSGPIHNFAFTNYDAVGTPNSTVGMQWDLMRYIGAGPGALTTTNGIVANPMEIAEQVLNNAIGNNSQQLTLTQSGTPIWNLAAAQGSTIPANTSVPGINCFIRGNGSANYTLVCINRTTSSQVVNFTGTAAPGTGTSVTKTIFGGSTNAITDNNANSYIGSSTTNPVVVLPTTLAPATGLNTDTLQPTSMTTYTYSQAANTCTLAPNTALVMHAGDPVLPPLIWTISGTGCTAAIFTSGEPTLSTTATSSSPVGSYPITISQGTLTVSGSYSLIFGTANLKVIPPDSNGAVNTGVAVPHPAHSAFVSGATYPALDVTNNSTVNVINNCNSGTADQTANINTLLKAGRATQNGNYFRNPVYIYFPTGCYKISGQLLPYGNFEMLEGDGPGFTVFQVTPNSTAFNVGGTTSVPVILWSSVNGNANNNDMMENFTLDIGYGNPNATAYNWVANNFGAVRNVVAYSEDSNSNYGVGFSNAYPGPTILKNVSYYGFKYSIQANETEYLTTMENVTSEAYTTNTIYSGGLPFFIRHLLSYGNSQAINITFHTSLTSQTDIIDSEILCANSTICALGIFNGQANGLYLRNVSFSNWTNSLQDNFSGTPYYAVGNLPEYYPSNTAQTLFNNSIAPHNLNLPESETPVAGIGTQPAYNATSSWIQLSQNPATDWQTSLNSCSSNVAWVPTGVITLTASTIVNINVPSCIQYILGYFPTINPSTSYVNFQVATTSADSPLVISGLPLDIEITQTGSRTVVDVDGAAQSNYIASAGAGNVYFEDVQIATLPVAFYPGQKIWARQFDAEGTTNKFTCSGCTMWLGGYKTERLFGMGTLTNNAAAEVFNWFAYPITCPVTSTNPTANTLVANISSITGSGTVATVNYSSALTTAYTTSQYVTIAGNTPSGYNTNVIPLTSTTTGMTYSSTTTGTTTTTGTATGTQCPNVGMGLWSLNNSSFWGNGYIFGISQSNPQAPQYIFQETKGATSLSIPSTGYNIPQLTSYYYSLSGGLIIY